MRIDSSGNVSIGTTNTSNKLTVAGGVSAFEGLSALEISTSQIKFPNKDFNINTVNKTIFSITSAGNMALNNSKYLDTYKFSVSSNPFDTTGNHIAYFEGFRQLWVTSISADSSGGFGDVATIRNPSSNGLLTVTAGGTVGGGEINLTGGGWVLNPSHIPPGSIVFRAGTAALSMQPERLRIDSSGNLNIGSYHSGGNGGRLTADGELKYKLSTSAGTYGFGTAGMSLGTTSNHPVYINTNSTERLIIDSSGNGLAGADNAYTWGGVSNRWSVIYAVNGTIQTSDINSKIDIAESTLGIGFIKSLNPVSYKFKVGGNLVSSEPDGIESVKIKDAIFDEDGNEVVPAVYEDRPKTKTVLTPVEGKRTHWGFVAQEVKAAADAAGVDFGGWIKTNMNNPDSEEGLRYDQFIAPLTKALQEAIAKIETLESKVAALEAT